jgi:hypothetical protein
MEAKKSRAKASKWQWKTFPPERYFEEIARLVHYTVKGVNTNAAATGVRLGNTSGRKLPYVAMVTTINEASRFALDYTSNRGDTATVVKQVANVVGWSGDARHVDAPGNEVRFIEEALGRAMATDHVELEPDKPISPRARQVIMPDGRGGYVTLIPLPAPVFAGHLQGRWKAVQERLAAPPSEKGGNPRRPYLLQAFQRYGGANAQNAGGTIRQMQSPFVFFGPTENPAMRRLYAIHYRGVSLRLPATLMQAYRQWRSKITSADGGVPTDLRLRQKEFEFVAEIARTLLSRGRYAATQLHEQRDKLPGGSLVAPEVDPVAAGLVDPSRRGADWPYQFAQTIAGHIAAYRFPDGGSLGLGVPAMNHLAGWIEQEVRRHGV